MTELGCWIALGACVALGLWRLARESELFCLSVRGGRVNITRGRLPQRLFDDMSDVLRGVSQARVRAVPEGGRARLLVRGDVSPAHAQGCAICSANGPWRSCARPRDRAAECCRYKRAGSPSPENSSLRRMLKGCVLPGGGDELLTQYTSNERMLAACRQPTR